MSGRDANAHAYDRIGAGYRAHRRPDPRIAAALDAALGDARTVVNVGAGAGSYEPAHRAVLAVEPSRVMCAQRTAGAGPAVRGVSARLPLSDRSVDAAMAVLTIHHWPDVAAGLREMLRVARGPVVLLTWDPRHEGFWLVRDYFPEILAHDLTIFPTMDQLRGILGPVRVRPMPVPHDCVDGFLCAYWRRPERYLDASARGAISSFDRLADPSAALARLRADLEDGTWQRRNADVASLVELDLGYRIVVARAGVAAGGPPAG